jgi:hypothetical protein
MENISERSKWWLFWYGMGKSTGIALTIIATYFAYKLFDNSNSAKLANELNSTIEKTISQNKQIDSLKFELDKNKLKRFVIHGNETRALFKDVYLHFYGGRDSYSIKKLLVSKPIITSETTVPTESPDTFSVDGQKYFIIAEEIFDVSPNADSVRFYYDSLRTIK